MLEEFRKSRDHLSVKKNVIYLNSRLGYTETLIEVQSEEEEDEENEDDEQEDSEK